MSAVGSATAGRICRVSVAHSGACGTGLSHIGGCHLIFPTLQGANGPWSVDVTLAGACGAIDEPACRIIGQGTREETTPS